MRHKKLDLLTVMAKAALAMDAMPDDTEVFRVSIGYDYTARRLQAQITIDDFKGDAVQDLAKAMGKRAVEMRTPRTYEGQDTYETFFFHPDDAVRITSFSYRKGCDLL